MPVDDCHAAYLEMRKVGHNSSASKKVITATPRQLQSIIRLAEALARMRLSKVQTSMNVRIWSLWQLNKPALRRPYWSATLSRLVV